MSLPATTLAFLTLPAEPEPTNQGKYNYRTMIPADIHSPLFRNLCITLRYYKKTASADVGAVELKLSEEGWGVPGLILDDTIVTCVTRGPIIIFDVQCSIELRLGSMEKDGVSVPLPVPHHLATIKGEFNTNTKRGNGVFHEFGKQ